MHLIYADAGRNKVFNVTLRRKYLPTPAQDDAGKTPEQTAILDSVLELFLLIEL